MMAIETHTATYKLPDDVLWLFEITWMRLGLGKLALANCLAGREPLDPEDVIILSKTLVPS
ncbi:MAG: hypothetical protein ACFFB3_06815 [Candidatus Hodarchaeota archaeon]